jgi:hypothetical protein
LEVVFVLLESPSPSRRIFISSHSLPPSLVRCIRPSAATAAIEWDLLASRLALAEAEIEKLRAVAASAEEAVERAKIDAATTETAARDAAQATACEKAALEPRVSELESDQSTTTTDLVTTSRQVSQVTNQL